MDLFVVTWNDLYSNESCIIGIYDSKERVLEILKKEYSEAKNLTEDDISDYADFEFNENDCIIDIKIIKLND